MTFTHDVFLSYSSVDKLVVRDLAVRLRDRGLRVWLDDWEIQPGDSIPSKIESGLENSSVLVLCMSEHALGSDWPRLESWTFRFRDPLNHNRRFIPLRLDDATPTGSLAQFLYVDWRDRTENEFAKLLQACQTTVSSPPDPDFGRSWGSSFSLGHTDAVNDVAYDPDGTYALSASDDSTVRLWNVSSGVCEGLLEGHAGSVRSVAYAPSGNAALSGSDDGTARVWDLASGRCLTILHGHTDRVSSAAYHPNGTQALTGSDDGTVRVWDLTNGSCQAVLHGHAGRVSSTAYHPDGTHALSGSDDTTIRAWNLDAHTCERILEGHAKTVRHVAYHPNGRQALSASDDNTVHLWDLAKGTCERVLQGHTGTVWSVACHPDGTQVLSASEDETVRVWDLTNGTCQRILRNHTGPVRAVAYSPHATEALSASADMSVRVWELASGKCERVFEGHTGTVSSVAYHPDGTRALSGSADTTVREWDLRTRVSRGVFTGHTGEVNCVAYHPDGTYALSASDDDTLRMWDLDTKSCERILEGHTGRVWSVAYHPDSTRALSGSVDNTVREWDLITGICQHVLRGHTGVVRSVAYHPSGAEALSGSVDGTLRVWDLVTGACVRILEGHTEFVNAVAYHPDGTQALSASFDNSVRMWNIASGTCERIFEGHTGVVWSVAYHPDGMQALSGSADKTIRVWDLTTGMCQRVLRGHSSGVRTVAYAPDSTSIFSAAENGVLREWIAVEPSADNVDHTDLQVSYTNAKVVLLGDSQAGKSGLAMRLVHDHWELTDSTIGAWSTQLRVPMPSGDDPDIDREIWLWDFGGQADQRLIHQLYLGDTAAAILVFDGQRDDLVSRLWNWNRAFTSTVRNAPKILVAGRTDSHPVRLATSQLDDFRRAAQFSDYFETSAKKNIGCPELRAAIIASINWSRIPWRCSPVIFRRLKSEILKLKDSGRALTSAKELRDWLPAQIGAFEPAELDAVIRLLSGPGVVLPLGFGDYVLLQPGRMNDYAQAVINSLRLDPSEQGCIREERVLNGELNYPADFRRLPEADEQIVLRAMHKQIIEKAICIRDVDPRGIKFTQLLFPSYFRRERPDRPRQQQTFMTYQFGGYLDELYTTLVVRLSYTVTFKRTGLWLNAADFETASGKAIGIRMVSGTDGTGDLHIDCEPGTPNNERVLFARYVQTHLEAGATDLSWLRTYICPECSTSVENRHAAQRRLHERKLDIPCSYCEARILLRDELEQQLSSPEADSRVAELRSAAQFVLDNESRERILVGEVFATAARANQIARELRVSDHGIDMEIEFKTDDGRASGCKLYLQLKSGDSHVRLRKRDQQRVFRVRKGRHADYWADQHFPVMLVVRRSSGEIEWMEIRDYLREQRAAGQWPAREIKFVGERFDVMSIRRWRGLLAAS